MPTLNPISSSQALGTRRAAHLLRRTTWGPTLKEINEFSKLTIGQALDRILAPANTFPDPPEDPITKAPWIGPNAVQPVTGNNRLKEILIYWWMETMRTSTMNLTERMVFFMHTHFTTIQSRVASTHALYYQLQLFRYHGLRNYKTLAKEICRDMAMMVHLDNNQNRAEAPNENFAREFLELYTVGKGPQIEAGNYSTFTEKDVKAVTRILSGYAVDATYSNVDPLSFHARNTLATDSQNRAYLHDSGSKELSAWYDNHTIRPNEFIDSIATEEAALAELDELVNVLFSKPYAAQHLAHKLYRFFVYDKLNASIEADIIGPLTQAIIDNDYEMEPVLRLLFSSKHFFEEDGNTAGNVIGALIKSPLELVLGTLRLFEAEFPNPAQDAEFLWAETYRHGLVPALEEMGFSLYEPFEVAGYPAYHQYPAYNQNWISSNTLNRRYNWAYELVRPTPNPQGYWMDVMKWVENRLNINDPTTLLDGTPDATEGTPFADLMNLIFPQGLKVSATEGPSLTAQRMLSLRSTMAGSLDAASWREAWQAYRQGGAEGTLRFKFQQLFLQILQSPEYQLH